jgi:predicted RNase H-like HicB family nuclease
MSRYTALIDGEEGAYGVAFPDLPGCVAQAATLEAALRNAGEALRDFIADALDHGEAVPTPRSLEGLRQDPDVVAALKDGATLASVALVLHTGKTVKANLSLDEGVLSAIDAEAAKRHLTRSAFVELMARHMLAEGV